MFKGCEVFQLSFYSVHFLTFAASHPVLAEMVMVLSSQETMPLCTLVFLKFPENINITCLVSSLKERASLCL